MLINSEIREKEVRLIDSGGEQLGIMSTYNALRLAEERNLDLVLIAPQSKPPVCKLLDYKKYRFDLIKKEKEERRNRKVVEVKDIQLSPVIDIGDLNTKARKTREILEDGNKVKVTLIMRGRQQAHPEIGFKIINEFFARVEDIATQEKAPTREGRTIMMVLAPSKKNK
ncbi:MAG: translation initiation factor IF-3 [Clostridiales bacterium]|nr:translation initiation factor IF-3 [Clostridiales bacterium]HOB64673.1 translation initiation factor IF-3 [Clostridia bacterium]HOK81185.1 translation initiation factor IF-3 [Clostridia bacterium]HOL60304.1 translation initiation factor IF-3 [Clostridia bacterium]HPO53061.1 translation initiation factor IF-3 [Clostridia bacterium]